MLLWGRTHRATLGRVSLLKSASTVSLLTLLSRITGLVRELLVASTFGASAMTDAFNVAFRIPNLFRRLFAEGAFSQAFVPVLAASKAQHGDAATHRLIDHVATLLTAVLLLTCLLGVVAAPLLVWVMASGLQQNPQGYDVAVVMTRFMFPYIGFMSLVALSSGVLNTWRRFAVSAATPVLLNICMISAAWLLAPWFKKLCQVVNEAWHITLWRRHKLGPQRAPTRSPHPVLFCAEPIFKSWLNHVLKRTQVSCCDLAGVFR